MPYYDSWITWKLLLISIWPLIMIGLGFFYTPFLGRKKYFINTIKSISISENHVSFETYNWFNYNSITISAQVSDMKMKVWTYQMFFKEKKVFLVVLNNSEENTFYLVDEFFDNVDDFLKQFPASSNIRPSLN